MYEPGTNVTFDEDISILEWYERAYFIQQRISVYGILPVCILGMFINGATFYLIKKRTKSRSSIRVYLMALTLIGGIQLLFTTHTSFQFICELECTFPTAICSAYRRILSPLMTRVSATVDLIHMWFMVALTCHRYWKISHPFHAHKHDTVGKAIFVICGVCLSALLFRMPMLLFGVEEHGNTTHLTPSHIHMDETYVLVYNLALNIFFFTLLPFVSLTMLNGLICRSLMIARRAIRKDCIHRNRELRAATAIVTIVTLFLLFHSLFMYDLILQFVFYLRVRFGWNGDDHEFDSIGTGPVSGSVSILLSAISSMLNPLIYVALGTSLRLCHEKIRIKLSSSDSKKVVMIPPTKKNYPKNQNNNNSDMELKELVNGDVIAEENAAFDIAALVDDKRVASRPVNRAETSLLVRNGSFEGDRCGKDIYLVTADVCDAVGTSV